MAPIAARATFAGRSVSGVAEVRFPEARDQGISENTLRGLECQASEGEVGTLRFSPGPCPQPLQFSAFMKLAKS